MIHVKNRPISFLIMLVGISLVLIGCTLPANRVVVPDPPVEPYEYIAYGHFDGIEVDENNLPIDQRHIGNNKGEVYVDDKEARSGTHSLFIESTGGSQANGFGVQTSLIQPLDAGETYRFTVWVRAPQLFASGEGREFYPRISTGSMDRHWEEEWFEPLPEDAQFSITYSNHLIYIRPQNDADQDPDDPLDWLPLSVTFTLPSDVGLNPVVNVYNDSNKPVWIDDLSFQRLP